MNKIRISAATYASIAIDGKYLVALNFRRFMEGKKVYTPIGGALEYQDTAKPFFDSLNVVFEKGKDLRFTISEDKLPEFEQWFYQQKDREFSPYRELREELIDEEKHYQICP